MGQDSRENCKKKKVVDEVMILRWRRKKVEGEEILQRSKKMGNSGAPAPGRSVKEE